MLIFDADFQFVFSRKVRDFPELVKMKNQIWGLSPLQIYTNRFQPKKLKSITFKNLLRLVFLFQC